MGTASLRRACCFSSAPPSRGRVPNPPAPRAHTSHISLRTSEMRRVCGLSSHAASWGRQPDLPIREADSGDTTETCCPCGWRPHLGMHSSVRQARTRTQWRVCQGMLPPKPDAAVVNALRRQHLASLRGDIVHRRRDRALARFVAWKAALPHSAAAAACEPYFGVPFRGARGQTLYKCTKCGSDRILGRFRATPCVTHGASGEGNLSPAQFQALAGTTSKTAAASRKKLANSRRLKLRGTFAGEIYKQEVLSRYYGYLRARRQYLHQCKRNKVTPMRCREWRVGHNKEAAQNVY